MSRPKIILMTFSLVGDDKYQLHSNWTERTTNVLHTSVHQVIHMNYYVTVSRNQALIYINCVRIKTVHNAYE